MSFDPYQVAKILTGQGTSATTEATSATSERLPLPGESLIPSLNSKRLKSETDLNDNTEGTPSTKHLKLEAIEHQSSASIVEEIARGKFELEQDKKNADKKIVNLEAEKNELETGKKQLLETLKISQDENVKKHAQIVELKKALTSYQEIFPSQLEVSLVPKSVNGFLEGRFKFDGLDFNKFPIYKHTSSEIFFRHSFEWDAGENNLLNCFDSNDPDEKMKFAQGMAAITSGKANFKRRTGIWLFTDSKTGKRAWSKINSNARNPVDLSKIQSVNWNFWSSPKPRTGPILGYQQMIFEKDLKAVGKWQKRYLDNDQPMAFEGINYKIENE